MILQIYCGNKQQPYKDVLCMNHEYDQYINSLDICRIPYEVKIKSLVDGIQLIQIQTNNASIADEVFY